VAFARILKVSRPTCERLGGRWRGGLCEVGDPDERLKRLREQVIDDRASIACLLRRMDRAKEAGLEGVYQSLQEDMDLAYRRLRAFEAATAELERALGAGAAAEEGEDRVLKRVRELEEALKDPEVRRSLLAPDWELLAERLEPRLERLFQLDVEIAGMVKGLAEEARRARKSAPPAGPPAGGEEGTVAAEFCGLTFLEAMRRIDGFLGATGLRLVDVRFSGMVETGKGRLECHRAVFRKGPA
jgi:hypothetical protein